MNFFKETIQILRDTTWPTKKQAWTDFVSVIQYSAFFIVLVYLFDLIVSKGILSLLNIF
ncbi:preprotein translocase subunit SecE [Streptococcus cameli]